MVVLYDRLRTGTQNRNDGLGHSVALNFERTSCRRRNVFRRSIRANSMFQAKYACQSHALAAESLLKFTGDKNFVCPAADLPFDAALSRVV